MVIVRAILHHSGASPREVFEFQSDVLWREYMDRIHSAVSAASTGKVIDHFSGTVVLDRISNP
jgi:hypothetical protein